MDDATSSAEDEASGRGDDVIDRVVREYLEAKERGEAVDRAVWLARHADIADELARFFESEDCFDGVVQADDRADASAGALMPERLGDYDVLGEIRRGGMGVVLRARHRTLGRVVAVKILVSGALSRPEDRERFRREAETVARLDHAGIVPIYDVGEESGVPWFAMKLIEGQDLSVNPGRWRAPRVAARVIADIARAVDHAHKYGVLHRDLKPANVMIDAEGAPHVTDFGLAKHVHSDDGGLTRTGAVVGTIKYLAPELAVHGSGAATVQTDVYALGMILYELLTGRVAFEGATPLDTMRQLVDEEPASPRSSGRGLAIDIETVCLKCLEKSPEKRYATAAELADDLERFVDGVPVRARRHGAIPRAMRWVRRRPTAAALLTLSALLIVGTVVASILYARREHEHRTEIEARDRFNRRYAYATHLELAYASWRDSRPVDALAHLESQRPGQGQTDLRDFPWYHLWGLLHRDDASRRVRGAPKRGGLARSDSDKVLLSYTTRRLVCRTPAGPTIWDIGDREARQIGHVPVSSGYAMDIDPAGELLAVAADGSGEIRLVRLDSGQPVRRFGAEPSASDARFGSARFSSDGSRLAMGHLDGRFVTWDVAAGKQTDSARLVDDLAVTRIAWSQGGSLLALVGKHLTRHANTLQVWDTASRAFAFSTPISAVHGRSPLVFSPDDSSLVYATGIGDTFPSRLVVLEPTSGKEIRSFERRIFRITAAAFCADGRQFISARHDGELIVRETDGWTPLTHVQRHPARLLAIDVVDDGFATACADGEVRFWRHDEVLRPRRTEIHADTIWHVASDDDRGTLVTADAAFVVRFSRVLDDGHIEERTARSFRDEYRCGSLSPDGRVVAGGSDRGLDVLRGAGSREALKLLWRSNEFRPREVEFSEDSTLLAAVDERSLAVLRLQDSADRFAVRVERRFDLEELSVTQALHMRFSPDRRLLFLRGGIGGSLYLFDLERPRLCGRTSVGGHGFLSAFTVSPDSKRLIAAYKDGSIRIWSIERDGDAIELRKRLTFKHGTQAVWALCFSPGGETFVTGSDDGTIAFWDLVDGSAGLIGLRRAVLDGHRGAVKCLSFAADGEALFSAGGKDGEFGEVLVWRAPRQLGNSTVQR